MEKPSGAWFKGVCDDLLAKMAWWLHNYERGKVNRTRPFLTQSNNIVDVPTAYLHIIPFKQAEVDHLVRLMTVYRPEKAAILDMLKITQRDLKQYPLRPGGIYAAPMPYYKADVQEIVDALLEAREGQASIKQQAEQNVQEGKFVWD